MIRSKQDLQDYLAADKQALGRKKKCPGMTDYIWRYERLLRICEYYQNCRASALWFPLRYYYQRKRLRLGLLCGFSIPLNVVGKGLSLAHTGTIIINSHAKLGEYCRIHADVNIGTAAGTPDQAPTLGNRIYIGPGAKIFGAIHIADDVAIGANAVVNHDCLTPRVTLGGIPAKVISDKGSVGILNAHT